MAWAKAIRIGAATAALALASAAHAGLGEGVQLGEKGRVRPFFDLEERWDSTVLFTSNGSAKGDLVTHIRPGLTLELPTPFADLTAAAHLDWAQYASETNLSRLYGGLTARAAMFRDRPVGLEVSEEFRRSDRTTVLSFGYGAISTYNDLQVWAPWRPGGGALTVALGGGWTIEHFSPFASGNVCRPGVDAVLCNTSDVSKLSYYDLKAMGQVRYKFLPRTAGLFDVAYVSRFPSDKAVSNAVDRVEVNVGVSGLVTPKLAATIKGGYGDTMGTAGDPFGTGLADLELEFLPYAGISARAGYVHGLGTDPGNFFAVYASHRLFVESKAQFLGIYTARLTATYDRAEYTHSDWAGSLGMLEPRIDVDVKPWLRLGAGYALTYRCNAGVSTCLDQMFTANANRPANDPRAPGYQNYKKHEVYLRADVIY